MNKLEYKLKKHIINTFKSYGDNKIIASTIKSYTGNEMANEIEKETEEGINQVEKIISLTIELIQRNKINNEWNSISMQQIPKDGKEYLTINNNNLKGPKNIIKWSNLYNSYICNNKCILHINEYATYWTRINDYIEL